MKSKKNDQKNAIFMFKPTFRVRIRTKHPFSWNIFVTIHKFISQNYDFNFSETANHTLSTPRSSNRHRHPLLKLSLAHQRRNL